MKLYCIVSDITKLANPDAFELLKRASIERGIDFTPLDAKTFSLDDVATLDADGIVYRMGLSRAAVVLEAYVVGRVKTTLYSDSAGAYVRGFAWGSTIRMQSLGLPIIPTSFNILSMNVEQLKATVSGLGGFPIIIKGAGGSHGSAVMRVDSMESLRSVLGYVAEREGGDSLVLRQYVDNARHLRLVVVGSEVADAIEYLPQDDDFRTNAAEVPQVKPYDHHASMAISEIACRAVNEIGLEFGGVDILMQPDGVFFIAEVNFPCNFARNQLNTGVDVAGQMVEYLIQKARR